MIMCMYATALRKYLLVTEIYKLGQKSPSESINFVINKLTGPLHYHILILFPTIQFNLLKPKSDISTLLWLIQMNDLAILEFQKLTSPRY